MCTLSAMVIKSTTAHIFHIGDARIYRVAGHSLEQLTEDHRIVVSSRTELSRPRARASIRRSRSTTGRSRSRQATFSCWRPTASMSTSTRASSPRRSTAHATISTAPRETIVEEALSAGQPGQPHRPDRPDRRPAGRRGAARSSGRRRNCPARRLLEARMTARRLSDRARNPRQQPQPHLSGRR